VRFPEPVAEEEAGSLHAPMPGTVVRVEVEEGRPVGAGAVVVVLEAMKMEHAVRAPYDGVVTTLHATVGQAVDTGHVLAVVTEP
jgi:biotin carboxyl carrier protein